MSEHHLSGFPDVERLLVDLRLHVAFPPTPDLAGTIRANINTRTARSDRPRTGWWTWQPRTMAIGFGVIVLAAAGLLAASPDLRTAVANRLGLGGIRIEFVDETPTLEASPMGVTLLLGEPTTLENAQARAPYVIQAPASLGAPDEVYLRQLSAGPMVSLLYRARPGLPEAAETGVGALLMQFPAGPHPADLAKRISMGEGVVIEVGVGEADGYWITGYSEFVIAQDPSEAFDEAIGRPSANVLLWQVGEVTYRLETDLDRAAAIQLAGSLQPLANGTPGTEPKD